MDWAGLPDTSSLQSINWVLLPLSVLCLAVTEILSMSR